MFNQSLAAAWALSLALAAWNAAGCSASGPHEEQGEAWPVAEESIPLEAPVDEVQAPKLVTHGLDPLEFAPGSFDWQPEDTAVVVHTTLESELHNIDMNEVRSQAGLLIDFRVRSDHPILPQRAKTRTWVAIDLEEMRFDGALHFFEVTAGDHDPLVQRRNHLRWHPIPEVTVQVHAVTNKIKIYIEEAWGYRRALGEEGVGRMDPPRVAEPWLELTERSREPLPIDVYVWRPQDESFQIIKAFAEYAGLSDYNPVTPRLSVTDRDYYP